MIDFIHFIAHISFGIVINDQVAVIAAFILITFALIIVAILVRLSIKTVPLIRNADEAHYENNDEIFHQGTWTIAESHTFMVPYGTLRGDFTKNK